MTSNRANRHRGEEFRTRVANFFKLALLPVVQKVPIDSLATAFRMDPRPQISHLHIGEHFAVSVSTGFPLDVSGNLDRAEANARTDRRPYAVAVIERQRRDGIEESYAVLSLDTLRSLIEQVERGGSRD
ncbi:hypothetical protein [Pseudoclavibacter terrae]|uniref:Uncharacterized protein n=1 Tax=Pseudoclavibacter terrae TaxID=1530195 RepID=A0A7J5B6U8_9MICO|nr:hypothetical protein [Pseudoclavibacter terrae]KAB1639703.1 hypothetical protein F8O03_05120 [Pseudoclavibacter terrae]